MQMYIPHSKEYKLGFYPQNPIINYFSYYVPIAKSKASACGI